MAAQALIRIAVVGAGLIGRRHAAHVQACPEAKLHAIVDPTDAAREVAAAAGVPWFAEIGAMLAAGKPDAVIVATPNSLHVEHGLAPSQPACRRWSRSRSPTRRGRAQARRGC